MCEKCRGNYYITTPIYYPSAKLHIGHAYCTVATDTMARFKRLQGYNVMFLTGTDEHGQKIEDKAKAAGVTPQQFVDNIVTGERGVLDLWKLMNISNDRFIRTTDDYHVAAIQRIFKKMHDNGDIYKGVYKGKYCKPCESFWTESQLKDGKCPDCGREVQDAEEEAYFFRLSKYADRVQDLLENTDFLEPRSRVNEMVNNFIKPGLEDLCVSRTSFTWGVPVDFDPGHVVYVWIDALFNYMTALGFENDKYHDLEAFWPADVHFVGKEIVRFHSIIWPAMLMSLNLPLPKKVYGHGWLLLDGGKMSKSKGNVVDPYVLAERFGVDALRFFLLRSFPFGSDGNFSNEAADQHHQRRPCQRSGQSGLPDGGHGAEVLRRAPARGADGGRGKGRRADRHGVLPPGQVRGADGEVRLPECSGGGVQGHFPRQQVYRRERPMGAGQGPRTASPVWRRCCTTCWRPSASAAVC